MWEVLKFLSSGLKLEEGILAEARDKVCHCLRAATNWSTWLWKVTNCKSSCIKLGYPLIRFDIAAAFGGIVGESESNIRQALRVAEAASPCVLWIDEIEKGLAGSGGSGDLDSGTTQRVFGTILTWLNEVSKPVFVVATANNLATLPPELKRKDDLMKSSS